MKKNLVIALASALALTTAPAVFADTQISPDTIIKGTQIGKLNMYTSIFSEHIGDVDKKEDDDTVIAPTTYISDTNASVVNIINNIIDIQIDSSKISSSYDDLRKSIFEKYGIEYNLEE